MKTESQIFWTGFSFTLLGFIAAVLFLTGYVSAAQVSVAYGDNLTYSNSNAPYYIIIPSSQIVGDLSNLNATAKGEAMNATAKCQAWMFGERGFIDPVPFTSHIAYYTVEIPSSTIEKLPEGDYDMYLQFPGKTGVMSMQYDPSTKELGSPFRNYAPVSLYGLTPRVAEDVFVRTQANTSTYGDTFYKISVVIGKPSVNVVNNYVTSNGDLYIGGTTNLAKGDRISGTIDPDMYVSPVYHEMMTDINIVTGDYQDSRDWYLVFPQNLSGQLSNGHHEVIVDLGQGVKYSVPFNRWQDPVIPTPTPEIRNIYAVNGEWMGQKVNTTAPTATPTPEPTINKTYETVLAKFRLNNRTLDNRGDVYIGEKNLDVRGAIGWPQPNGDWVIQYCDYWGPDYNMTVTIKDPKHFDISRDVFKNDYGAWCQYSTFEAGKARQPVAFWVRSDLPYVTPNATPVPPANQTVNVTQTEDVLNVTITPTAITSQPTADMATASDTIVVPLPWWMAVVAVTGVIVWRRK
jgi:hypothetical protein